MRLDVVGESMPERIAVRMNLVPVPLAHTHMALVLARAVLEASKAGIFEALGSGALDAAEVAVRTGLNTNATVKLLNALAASDYVVHHKGRFSLTAMSRKWMLPSSADSVHEKIMFTFFEDTWIARLGDYLRTGRDVTGGGHLGASQPEEFWGTYQRAMRSIASMSAGEVARRTRVPPDARDMLDIGGSHGLYSVAICRRHPHLSSTILDLPDAIAHAAPLLAAEGMGTRVVHLAGNALEVDLGESRYDVIFISNLVHHFDAPTNQRLMVRVARALRPGGIVTVQELIRSESPVSGNQIGALLDLYFAVTSTAGTWSVSEISGWQRDAGLVPRRPLYLRTMPGAAQQAAAKRR
jgi:2-polyprenyl-3-methyl-5-hydroxy-6-metoxy-1,4-benzoquinol methylase